MSVNTGTYAEAIGGAVRAELARRGQSVVSLVPVLGISKGSVYARTQGRAPFDYVELQKIAAHLGTTVVRLVESAEEAAA